ncbi:MAG TPA: hypothetical protein DDW76_21230 [Cyanobacteria bacterium UBA11369]|nr:hypothetical protein [Cyanobacteria bacterium UBA11371]HBE35894.1 hypothetical protein [Cyanobacteria bacterium UBA11368]HBE51224.1 hypothetical protein [Cyanobacteria bacterium UBA11369]
MGLLSSQKVNQSRIENINMKNQRFSLLTTTLLLTSWSVSVALPGDTVTFSTPKGASGAPRQETTGGATRNNGACLSNAHASKDTVTPLVPNTRLGLTVSERPTFFVYVPQTTAKEATFSLQDASRNLIYRTKVALRETGGVIRITVPETVKALEMDNDYRWVVEIHCIADLDPDNPFAEGWVRRTSVNANLAGKLETAKTSLERATAYSQEGIWYEALENMADAVRSQPQDSTRIKSWEELLTSVGLQAIAKRPLTL